MSRPTTPSVICRAIRLYRFPRTWEAIIRVVKRHAQRRWRNQPKAAKANADARRRKGTPMSRPSAVSSIWARGLRDQARSNGVPGQSKVIPAKEAIAVPKYKKRPIARISLWWSGRMDFSMSEFVAADRQGRRSGIQGEDDVDGAVDFDGLAVQERGTELPLQDGVNSGFGQDGISRDRFGL
jgi:hypothetical protein